jgi:hypothetical protein
VIGTSYTEGKGAPVREEIFWWREFDEHVFEDCSWPPCKKRTELWEKNLTIKYNEKDEITELSVNSQPAEVNSIQMMYRMQKRKAVKKKAVFFHGMKLTLGIDEDGFVVSSKVKEIGKGAKHA